MIEILAEIAKFFVYLFVYIKNCRKWQMHILGLVMSVITIIYIPKGGILGCTTMEWLLVLLPVNILISGAVSAWIYSKAVSKENLESESCYKNELRLVDAQPEEIERREFDFRDTVEEGVEDFIPLENGGFRRIYKVRRFGK